MNFALFWSLVGLLLIASEMIIPGFTIFFFGAGALLTALATLIIPGMGVGAQTLLWAGSSIAAFLFLRKRFRSVLKGTIIYRDGDADKYAGREAEVITPIAPDTPGRIRFQGTSWEAISYDETLPAGEKALILRQEGMRFIVGRPVPEADLDMN